MGNVAVGIDLGTTNSVVAISQAGRPRVLASADGGVLIPSVVSFHPNGQTIVGTAARARRPVDPTNTVFSVKRLMGRPFDSEEVKRARARFAFEMSEGPDAAILVKTRTGDLSLPEISALVLREIRRVGEAALGEPIDRAVVTVPANFNELQRTATKVAGQIADLEVIRILNEPTAAALAYGYGRGTREKIAVYDFGGGTFDVTLLELSGNVFEVLATAGDTFLGGDDIDLLLTENLADALLRSLRIDARQDRRTYELLRAAAEQAKIDVSTSDVANIRVTEVAHGPGGRPMEFRTRITRPELEAMAEPLIARTMDVCSEAMKLAGLQSSDFDTVILVGGSSRMPAVRARVAQFFGRDPLTTLPPEQVVGLGAAILAEALTGGARRARPAPTATPAQRPRTQTLRPPDPTHAAVAPGRTTGGSTRPGLPSKPPPAQPMMQPRSRSNAPPSPATGVRLPSTDEAGSADAAGGSRHRYPTNPGLGQFGDLPKPRASDLSWSAKASQPPPGLTPTQSALDEPTGQQSLDSYAVVDFDDAEEQTHVGPRPGGSSDISQLAPPAGSTAPAERSEELTSPRVALPHERIAAAPSPFGLPPAPFAKSTGDSLFGATANTGTPATRPAGPSNQQPLLAVGTRTAPMPAIQAPIGVVVAKAPDVASTIPSVQWNDPTAPPDTASNSRNAAPALPPASAVRPGAPLLSDSFLGFPKDLPDARQPPVVDSRQAPPPAASPFDVTTAQPASSNLRGAQASTPGASAMSPPAVPQQNPPRTPAQAQVPVHAQQAASGPRLTESLLGFKAVQPPQVGQPFAREQQQQQQQQQQGSPGASGFPPARTNERRSSVAPPAAPLLLDVTPHSLSVETVGGLCEVVIPRNATIPVEQSRQFATAYDGQEGVRIRISQGESRRFGENQALGELELSGISRAPRGEVTVAVTFELDADGTLNVRAKEVATGRETQTRVVLLTMPSAAATEGMAQRQRDRA